MFPTAQSHVCRGEACIRWLGPESAPLISRLIWRADNWMCCSEMGPDQKTQVTQEYLSPPFLQLLSAFWLPQVEHLWPWPSHALLPSCFCLRINNHGLKCEPKINLSSLKLWVSGIMLLWQESYNCLTFWGTARLFPEVTIPFYIPTNCIKVPTSPIFDNICYCLF